LAVVALFCSRPILYNYYNPFLTDGLGMLVLFLLSMCFIADKLGAFAAVVAIGVFVRESAFFVFPAWLLTPKLWKAVAVCAITMGLFLAPRIIFPSSFGYGSYLFSGVAGKFSIHWLVVFAKGLILSWYALWIPFAFGLWRFPRRIQLLIGSLVLGALASCVVATDLQRMLSVLSPVIVPVAALVIERARRAAVLFFIGTLPLQFAFGTPYVLQQLSPISYRTLLVVTVVISAAASARLITLRELLPGSIESAAANGRLMGAHTER
jgi:hypothetical protein